MPRWTGSYGQFAGPAGREVDIAIGACAITYEAQLWTLNTADFKDIPGLRLYSPV
jgi:predicted nucleic acid-binding protein